MNGLGSQLRFAPTDGQKNDITQATALLQGYSGQYVIADKGYDTQWLREYVAQLGMTPALPGRSNRTEAVVSDAHFYGECHLVECMINRAKRHRRVFTWYDKLGGRNLGFWHFAAALVWLR